MKNLIWPLCLGLSGCAAILSPGDPAAHQNVPGGESYSILQLTANTWTVTSTGVAKPLANTASATAGLRQAVEKVSGCKVTDSDYSGAGTQFDAQVDCGGLSR